MYPNQPQGYAPQQQYHQPMPGWPHQGMPAQYSAPPSPVQAPAAEVMPPQFSDGGTFTGTGTKMPAVRELVNRTVVIVPLSVDETNVHKGQPRPSGRADLYVIDGGPLVYGSNQEDGTPATHQINTPCVFKGWTVGNVNIVREIRAALANRSMPVGVVYRSTFGQKPFNLGKVRELPDNGGPRPDGEQRWQAMQAAFDGLSTGRIPNPEPVELNPKTGQGQGYQPQYVPVQQPAYGYGQPGPMQQVQQQYAPHGGAPAAPQPSAFAQMAAPEVAQVHQQNPIAHMPVSAPAAQPSAPLPPAPPGFELVWHTFSPEQRAALLQGMAAQQAAQAAPAPGTTSAPSPDGGPGF